MSEPCGLGIRTLNGPFSIKECRPPEKGPSKPSALNLRIKRRRERGLSTNGMVMAGNLEPSPVDPRESVTVPELQDQPFFKNFLQDFPALFESFFVCPNPPKSGNLAKECLVLQYLIVGLLKNELDIG